MIYLIETFTGILGDTIEEGQPIHALKIGYSSDERGEGRFKDYINAGLVIRVLNTIPGGSIRLEHLIQKEFGKYRIPGRSIEWFFVKREILDFFNNCKTEEDAYKLLKTSKEQVEIGTVKIVNKIGFVDFFSRLNDVSEIDKSSFLPIMQELDSMKHFSIQLKFICEEVLIKLKDNDRTKFIKYLPILFQTIILNLSLQELKSLSYRKLVVIRRFEDNINNQLIDISDQLIKTFKIGEKYRLTDVKDQLRVIYQESGLKKTPKATDLLEFFNLKTCNIFDEGSNKYGKGFEILSIKQ